MAMQDKMIHQKLAQLVTLCNELDAEAKRRYGPGGNLYFESEGTFHIMSGDDDPNRGTTSGRQSYIEFSSKGYCRLGSGAW